MKKKAAGFYTHAPFLLYNPVLALTNWTPWSVLTAIPDDTECRTGSIKLEPLTRKSESIP